MGTLNTHHRPLKLYDGRPAGLGAAGCINARGFPQPAWASDATNIWTTPKDADSIKPNKRHMYLRKKLAELTDRALDQAINQKYEYDEDIDEQIRKVKAEIKEYEQLPPGAIGEWCSALRFPQWLQYNINNMLKSRHEIEYSVSKHLRPDYTDPNNTLRKLGEIQDFTEGRLGQTPLVSDAIYNIVNGITLHPATQDIMSRFPAWVLEHMDDDEDATREHAMMFMLHPQLLKLHLGDFAKRTVDLNPRTIRIWIRKARRQAQESIAYCLRLVSSRRQKYASTRTTKDRTEQKIKQDEWRRRTRAVNEAIQASFQMPTIDEVAHARFSEMYVLTKGMSEFYRGQGFLSAAVTITTPAEYHPSPATGENRWSGLTPRDARDWINDRLQNFRNICNKELVQKAYFRVNEPHQDGCAHSHMLLFYEKQDEKTIFRHLKRIFGHSEHAIKIEKIDENIAKAETYFYKYIMKGIAHGPDDTASNIERIDAWRSTWSIRSFSMSFATKAHRGVVSKWRTAKAAVRQAFPNQKLPRALEAAKDNNAKDFFIALARDTAKLKKIDVFSNPDPRTGECRFMYKKIVGLTVKQGKKIYDYTTYTSGWKLETNFHNENQYVGGCTVNVSYPSAATDEYNFESADELDKPPKPPKRTFSLHKKVRQAA